MHIFSAHMANFAAKLYPNIALMKYHVFIVMYGAAVPFYFALYQAFNLLRYIDENAEFSELTVKVLKNIKYCAITISGLYVLGLPLFRFKAIIINVDVMLAKRKMSVTELSEWVRIVVDNISINGNSKAKAVRFSTLES